jgi:DNA helicase-2/ATP-dependent DNA helicase PcrA
VKDSLSLLNSEIDDIASLCSWSFDEERKEVLRRGTSCDVRACAGSGKTTLLVAKLVGLTSRWPHAHRGICVLSHTNVARREIERQFPRWAKLQMLNQYPHFVGTIQSFVNQFLAANAIQTLTGNRPSCLDDDQYAFEVSKRFTQSGKYKTAFVYLKNRLKNTPEPAPQSFVARKLRYVFSDGKLVLAPLTSAALSENTASYKELFALKEELTSDGCFSYADTTALALMYLEKYPRLREALCRRFPIVLVDEAQDTEEQQAELLDRLFLKGGVLQRFGDDRQAILSSGSTEDVAAAFPRTGNSGIPILPLKRSLRLSESIAKLVTMVCHGEKEELGGDSDTPVHSHSIFLFSQTTIGDVLPSFCNLVHSELGGNVDPTLVKAVGFSTVGKGPNALPSAVSDYWDGFEPIRGKTSAIRSFADGMRRATDVVRNGDGVRDAYTALLTAFTRCLAAEGIKNNGAAYTPISLLRKLRVDHVKSETLLRRTLVQIIRSIALGQTLTPLEVASRLGECVSTIGWTGWGVRAKQYIDASVTDASFLPAKTMRTGQVFEWAIGDDTVRVGLGTIHSVKGETLRAALVLETKFHEHDLQTMVNKGYFTGTNAKKPPSGRELKFLRTSYVAMSRPTHLLCVALLADHVSSEQRVSLGNVGWVVKEL